jgi:Flp pilus assembly protein TadD
MTAHLFALIAALAFAPFAVGTASAQERDLGRAEELLKASQPEQALQQVESYLANRPRDARGRFLKGVILAEQKKTAEAAKVFLDLTADFPELPEPYNNLAVLYAAQGDYDKARFALEMALRADPRNAVAYENLGDIYARMAGQSYEKALALDKTNRSAPVKLKAVNEMLSNAAR